MAPPEVAFCSNRRRDANLGAGLTPNKRRRSFGDFGIRLVSEFRFQWCHSQLDCRMSRGTTLKMRSLEERVDGVVGVVGFASNLQRR